MQNNSLSKKSKRGGILNIFRNIQTRVLHFIQRSSKPIFLKDDLVGEFSGNILERITQEGVRGFRYFVNPGTSIQVLEVVSSVYQEKHRIKGYPGMFNGTEDHLPTFCLNVDYNLYNEKHEVVISDEYFVIWLPKTVQVNAKST